MYQDVYYVDKDAGNLSDSLLVFGLADVLHRFQPDEGDLRIIDQGTTFVIQCQTPISLEAVRSKEPFLCVPFILTPKNKAALPAPAVVRFEASGAAGLLVDYEAEKQRRKDYFVQRDALIKMKKTSGQELVNVQLAALQPPHPNWEIFRAINPGALATYNNTLSLWWRAHENKDTFVGLIEILLKLFASSPNDTVQAQKEWSNLCAEEGWGKDNTVTMLQLFNPAQGQGQNHPKANKLNTRTNVDQFWLIEYLKALGMYRGALTRIISNPSDPMNAKDRKTYALIPHSLSWQLHTETLQDFVAAMPGSETGVKLDVMIALRYTQALVKHMQKQEPRTKRRRVLPTDFVSGMHSVYYKNLGNSAAVMNISSLGLPAWVVLEDGMDPAPMLNVLEEQVHIVRNLDERVGDQCDMLVQYRAFLTGPDWNGFFRFASAYGAFVMQQWGRDKFARPITVSTLEVIMNNSGQPQFAEILADEGFRRVAAAIRASTITPQTNKRLDRRPFYEIRYGLGQDLMRQANTPANFLSALGAFLADYNRENGQMRERHLKDKNAKLSLSLQRITVTTTDLESITQLVDRFGARVVCNLLVAYGYASNPRNGDDESPAEVEAPQEVQMTDAE